MYMGYTSHHNRQSKTWLEAAKSHTSPSRASSGGREAPRRPGCARMARRILASPTAAWERAFASFVAYPADADGKRRVPSKHVTSDGFALGSWIARQLNAH